MKKKTTLITGSGVIGAYLAKELLKKKHKIIVTSRYIKKNYKNYQFLKIQKKVQFIKLNILSKNNISKVLEKYSPDNIFYFSGQSSIAKSLKLKKSTFNSNFLGAKNFLIILKKKKLKTKFFKANSAYIFYSKNGIVSIKSKISNNQNPYIKSQIKAFKIIRLYRKKGINCYNLIFFQVESPLRAKDFLIKKACIHAKYKKKINVGNIKTVRDYSWAPEIVKGVYFLTKLSPCDIIFSSGYGISGEQIIKFAYKESKLNYKKYFKINNNLFRRNEVKTMIGSKNNTNIIKNNFKWKLNTFGKKLVKKMFKSI